MKKYFPEIIGAIFCLLIGSLAGYATKSSDFAWYVSLNKPSFNPPDWIFAPVWTILYLLMGISLGKLYKLKHKTTLGVFFLQLFWNILWSPLFFNLHKINLALYDIAALWATLIILLFRVWKNRLIFILLLPYGLWVSFAFILNISLFLLN